MQLFSFFVFSIILSLSNPSTKDSLTVQFPDLETSKGNIYLQVMNAERKIIHEEVFLVTSTKATAVIKKLPKGRLSIRAFQDLNGNGKMDIGLFGPKEPYGFSNNVRGTVGEPSFPDQLFSFPEKEKITIYLK